VRRRPDGVLVVDGRDKDMTNRGGEQISAEEVENLVHQLPQVAHVVAVAMPDAELGERVCICAVLKPGTPLTSEDARGAPWPPSVLPGMSGPERLDPVEELLTTKLGKIDKKAFREDVARRPASADPVVRIPDRHTA
jgi:2,3-dihydroxybenzoate-AMP ligase